METARDVLTALAWRYAFGDLAALALATDPGAGASADGGSASRVDLARVRALCAFGQGLLDLDAEDFGDHTPDTPPPPVPGRDGHVVPRDLVIRACASRMPQSPDEVSRGALRSLRPAYSLLLEVIEARWRRREMAALVAVVHIAAEYFPLLAWEPVLGHAADPALLARTVAVPGSLFGTRAERACAHSRPEQSATHRALGVAHEPGAGWRAYLDRQHSHVARALGVCVARCRRPCPMPDRLDPEVRELLTERCQVALDFSESALVKLRHAAPVGHGFGVPSPEEVQEAWARTRDSLAGKYPSARAAFAERPAARRVPAAGEPSGDDGRPGADARQDTDGRQVADGRDGHLADGFPLDGLPALFSAVAGAPIVPDTLLRDVAGRLAAAFDPAVPVARRPPDAAVPVDGGRPHGHAAPGR
jgi:hypothetical protein